MTRQYIIGEFSTLVGELESTAGEFGDAVRDLRREIETCSLFGLPRLAHEALALSDLVCWVALERGDVTSFRRCADTAVILREFTASANLLP
jgi:hypothetical protein